ncbi:Cold-regulated 413 inner membrane protein 1, chloroplastic-like protein [Drosera capensis]
MGVLVLMLAKGTAINKAFLVPLFALQAPQSIIAWMQGEYGTWSAFLALLVRIFFFTPGPGAAFGDTAIGDFCSVSCNEPEVETRRRHHLPSDRCLFGFPAFYTRRKFEESVRPRLYCCDCGYHLYHHRTSIAISLNVNLEQVRQQSYNKMQIVSQCKERHVKRSSSLTLDYVQLMKRISCCFSEDPS